MWIPSHDSSEDRHHQIFFRCPACRALKKACQFFGHCADSADSECSEPRLKTINDTPICTSPRCKEPDFMVVSHCLYQVFCDADGRRFNVFFKSPEEVDSFFRDFPAKLCFSDNSVWCKFNSVLYYHHQLRAHDQFRAVKITARSKSLGNGQFRYDFVSGFLHVSL